MGVYGVYGASGFGREVIPLVRKELNNSKDKVVFIDDGQGLTLVNGYEVLTWEEFSSNPESDKFINIAIANSATRKNLAVKCEEMGIPFFSVIAENAFQLDSNEIGEGAIFCPFSMLTSNVKIGKHFHLNIYSYIAHDCIVGDYVTVAPMVQCNGNVVIHDHAYIGTGAIIKQGTPDRPLVIGEGAVIGMGAVVTKDVLPFTTVIGNPARIYSKS
jgi:sugar O-acyltransferase (sialic acid O-acetyltransferase NeuD family)